MKSDFLIDIVVELGEGFTDELREVKERKGIKNCNKAVIAKSIDIDSIPIEVVKQMFEGEGIRLIALERDAPY